MGKTDGTKPKYVELMEYIRRQIATGVWPADYRLPKESELMEQFSVSKTVVNCALTRLALNGEIYRVSRRGTFVADPAVQQESRRSQTTEDRPDHFVLMLHEEMETSYAVGLANEAYRVAVAQGALCSVMFYDPAKEESENHIYRFVRQNDIDGLILFPSVSSPEQRLYSKELIGLQQSDFPIVMIDQGLPGLALPLVQTDNQLAGRLATRALIEKGHRQIAFCGFYPFECPAVQSRFLGYMSEMADNGLSISPDMVLAGSDEVENTERLKKLLDEGRATGFVCMGERVTRPMSAYLRQRGMRCPQDVSFVTIDWTVSADEICLAPSRVVQDTHGIVTAAVNILRSVKEEQLSAERCTLISPRFEEGDSVAELHSL